VFPNWQGNPEKLQNVYRRCWHTLQEEVGFVDEEVEPKYPLKDLRHVGASMEIDNGANLKEITMLMGHASVKIIYDVYEQFVPGKIKSLISAVYKSAPLD
jgi:site-specific recombinase XerD